MSVQSNHIYENRKLLTCHIPIALMVVLGFQFTSIGAYAKDSFQPNEIWTTQKGKRGEGLYLEKFRDPSNSKLPLPSQQMLNDVLVHLKCLRILNCRMDTHGNLVPDSESRCQSTTACPKIIFQSSSPMALEELKGHLRLKTTSDFPLATHLGSPTIELTLTNGRVVHLGLIDDAIRWNAWRYDAFLLNPSGFVHWLAKHGATGPLLASQQILEDEMHLTEREKASIDEFVRTMPKSLRLFFGKLYGSSGGLEDLSEKYKRIPVGSRLRLAKYALSSQYSNELDQIGALLEWEGNVTDYWTHYQNFPIELLLEEYNPRQVISKIKNSSLSTAQWVGVSRYFSDTGFKNKFPSDHKLLTEKLRNTIIERVSATGRNRLDVNDFKKSIMLPQKKSDEEN